MTMPPQGTAYLRWFHESNVWKTMAWHGIRTLKLPSDIGGHMRSQHEVTGSGLSFSHRGHMVRSFVITLIPSDLPHNPSPTNSPWCSAPRKAPQSWPSNIGLIMAVYH